MIKLAPVVLALKRHRNVRTDLVLTGQHRELIDEVIGAFDLDISYDLALMAEGQSLAELTTKCILSLVDTINTMKPDLVVGQGDTTSAMAASLAAYYCRVPFAHVEAGLRTGDKYSPFPEEINRRIAATIADLHFAPTKSAARNLRREGVSKTAIRVTGNTVVDSVEHLVFTKIGRELIPDEIQPSVVEGVRLVVATVHRRESIGEPMRAICRGLRRVASKFEDVHFVVPLHPNPAVRRVLTGELGGRDRIILCRPLGYLEFLALLKECVLILTDSGGVQEEAPSLGKPVLVLREVTERPEGIRAGVARLVGRSETRILEECGRLLSSPSEYAAMVAERSPYGDGRAGKRVARAMVGFLRAN